MSEQCLFRLRIRYVKQGRLRYLGHLEVMHTIERSVRRAGLPYAVTQGFSPHLRAGFSSALPVGTGSTCEWYDLFLTELVPIEDALARLKAATPADLAPQEAGYIDVRAAALTSFITRANYSVQLVSREGRDVSLDGLAAAFDRVAARGEIPYQRGRKTKRLDLGRTLKGYAVHAGEEAGTFGVDLKTYMDNEGALRPEILLAAIDAELRGEPDAAIESTGIQNLVCFERYQVERVAQFGQDETGRHIMPL